MSEEYWKINNRTDAIPDGFKNTIRWLDRELPLEQPLGSILEAGCGSATYTPHLARRTGHLRSCDHSATQIATNCSLYSDANFFVQNLGKPIAAEAKSFDAVWCAQTLDQLRNPGVALNEFYRVLKPGGKLLIAVPYHGFPENLLTALFHWDTHFAADNPHIRFFSVKMLSELVKRTGFRKIETETCTGNRSLTRRLILLSAKK